MTDNATSLALIAIVGTVITALFKLLNNNTKALGKLVESNEHIAKETHRGATEAKQRNGHLAELVLQGNNLTKKVVSSLETSAVTLTKGTKQRAEAVERVRTDLHTDDKMVTRKVKTGE